MKEYFLILFVFLFLFSGCISQPQNDNDDFLNWVSAVTQKDTNYYNEITDAIKSYDFLYLETISYQAMHQRKEWYNDIDYFNVDGQYAYIQFNFKQYLYYAINDAKYIYEGAKCMNKGDFDSAATYFDLSTNERNIALEFLNNCK